MTNANHDRPFSAESERMRREGEDVTVGAKLRRACVRTGTKSRDVATSLELGARGETTIAEVLCGRRTMHVRQLQKLPDSVYGEFMAELASDRGYAVVRLPAADAIAADMGLEWTERQAAAFTALLRAAADLRFDRAEANTVIETGMAFVRHVLGWVEFARVADREGVAAIPLAKARPRSPSGTRKAAS
jgi:hypothetical protein